MAIADLDDERVLAYENTYTVAFFPGVVEGHR